MSVHSTHTNLGLVDIIVSDANLNPSDSDQSDQMRPLTRGIDTGGLRLVKARGWQISR